MVATSKPSKKYDHLVVGQITILKHWWGEAGEDAEDGDGEDGEDTEVLLGGDGEDGEDGDGEDAEAA